VFCNAFLGFLIFARFYPNLSRRRSKPDLHRVFVVDQDLVPVAPGRTMAFVNHDRVEIIGWVILSEELRLFRAMVDRLIGRDKNTGVLLRMKRVHFGRIISKKSLEVSEPVIAQFRTITDKERFSDPTRVEKLSQQRGRQARFASAGSERKHDTSGLSCLDLAKKLLERRANGCILVVAEKFPAFCVRRS